jgi:hypothetical protein
MWEWLRESWYVLVAVLVLCSLIAMLATASISYHLAETECQTAGYTTMAFVGDVRVCVGRHGGEYVAVPLETVRSRLNEK